MIAADRYEEMVGTVIKKNRWNNRKRWISTRNSSFLWETMGIRLCCGLLLDPSNIYLLYGKVAFRTRSNRFYSRSMRFSKRRPIELFRLKNARRTRIITLLNAIAFLSIIDRINRSCESRKYEQSSTSPLPPPSLPPSKLTFEEIPSPRSAYDPPRSCARSLQRSSLISRPIMLPLFNSI